MRYDGKFIEAYIPISLEQLLILLYGLCTCYVFGMQKECLTKLIFYRSQFSPDTVEARETLQSWINFEIVNLAAPDNISTRKLLFCNSKYLFL